MGDHNRDWQRYSDVQEIPRWAVLSAIALLLVALVVALLVERAHARWSPQLAAEWGDVDESTRSWFRGVRSPHGVPCCDIADGHKTAYRVDSEGHYSIPLAGTDCPEGWCSVPQEAVVYNAGNPEDSAIVWYVKQSGGTVYIRCFVPTGGV